MENKSIILSENGFTIISVIIAASIASVVGLAISTLIVSQSSSVSYLEDRLSTLALDSNLQLNFSDSQACTHSLKGKSILGSQNIMALKDKDANEFVSASPSSVLSSYDRLDISAIQLVNVNATNAPGSSGKMNLLVNIERQRNSGPRDLKPKELKLAVTVDASGKIDTCSLTSGSGGGEFEKACGKAPDGSLKNNCSGRSHSSDATGDFCRRSTSSGTIFLHGDTFSKATDSGRNDDNDGGSDAWTETSYWKCLNGSWTYAGTSGSSAGGRNNRLF